VLPLLGAFVELHRSPEAQTGGVSSHFRVTGEVHATVFHLEKLEALPVTNENVCYFAGAAAENSTFARALLWDVLNSVSIVHCSRYAMGWFSRASLDRCVLPNLNRPRKHWASCVRSEAIAYIRVVGERQ
jgi:hypothetical protein